MRRRCPQPAAAPLDKFPNCPVTYQRVCTDGTGIIIETLPGAYLFSPVSQEDADEMALTIARGRALNQTLFCNTLSAGDLDGCGLIEGRPPQTLACSQPYCNESGVPYCNEDSINYVKIL